MISQSSFGLDERRMAEVGDLSLFLVSVRAFWQADARMVYEQDIAVMAANYQHAVERINEEWDFPLNVSSKEILYVRALEHFLE